MTLVLRDYQRAAVDALYAYWEAKGGNGLIVLPTGSGKSLIIAALCQELLRDYPGMRIGIVTHVRELILQNYNELIGHWPLAPAGIYSAGMRRRDTHAKILFLGIQSVWNRTAEVGALDLLLVDEAHLVSHSDGTRYKKFLADQRELVPDLRIAGLTATPFRLDTGRLDRGDGKIFDDIVYEANVRDLIASGYLCKPVTKATVQKLDVSKVGKRAGEFITSELEAAVNTEQIVSAAVGEIIAAAELDPVRKSWLTFCVSIEHGEHVCRVLNDRGIKAAAVYGHTPRAERDEIIQLFKDGELTCLISVTVLVIGFNVPHIDLIALLRPTQSAGLFLQQVGRGLRNAEGKVNCLVLDFAENTKRHGPIDTISSDKINITTKVCPGCKSIIDKDALVCPDCGLAFIPEEVSKDAEEQKRKLHFTKPDLETEIISSIEPKWVPVGSMTCHVHTKFGSTGPQTMRVVYFGEKPLFPICTEWVCLSHPKGSYAHQKAMIWWQLHASRFIAVPDNVHEGVALQDQLIPPSEILIVRDGKFFRIVKRKFVRETTAVK